MKLELKHIAPYLTYKVRVNVGEYLEKKIELTIDALAAYDVSAIKPFLRKISDITDNERKQLFNLVFGRAFPYSGGQVFIDKKTTLQEPRWVLSSAVDRLGILQNGEVWYDCDLSPYKFNQHLITLFYLEKHFDLFGLIHNGLATPINLERGLECF